MSAPLYNYIESELKLNKNLMISPPYFFAISMLSLVLPLAVVPIIKIMSGGFNV